MSLGGTGGYKARLGGSGKELACWSLFCKKKAWQKLPACVFGMPLAVGMIEPDDQETQAPAYSKEAGKRVTLPKNILHSVAQDPKGKG